MAKIGLVIGINDYPGTSNDLAGCVNDANDWERALQQRGFATAKLLDSQATKQAILEEMQRLVFSLEYRDIGVITFSGHGTWVPDRDGDELDKKDEAICAHDIRSGGIITDDELYKVFQTSGHGERVVFISDSCFSGTLERLAGPLAATSEAQLHRRVKFLPPAAWIDEEDYELLEAAEHAALAPTRGRRRKSALVLGGCRDDQVAYDAWFDRRPNGAFTYAALKALKVVDFEQAANYRSWYREIRKLLPSVDYEQIPQLDGLAEQKRWPILESSIPDD